MKIDGEDILTYGAKQWSVEPGFLEISNGSDWVEDTLIPTMLTSTTGFKKMKVEIIIKGESRQKIWENGSKLVAKLLKPSVIKFDGFDHNFYMYLKNAEQVESSLQRWHKATFELYGYEYSEMVTVATSAKSITISNEGSLETPIIVEITPTIGKVSLTISGIVRDKLTGEDKPVLINALTTDKTIVIDAETGLITEDGVNKFKDVALWDLPSILPGTNIITLDKDDINVTIKYKPRFM